jgi:predicted nucleic acid-binding protein
VSVPATERAFTGTPPAHLYLDTNVILDYLIATRPLHQLAVTLFDWLDAYELTTLYVSSLSWLEFAHVVARPSFRDALPTSDQQRYQLDKWHTPAVRRAYMRAMLGFMEQFLGQSTWNEVAVTTAVRSQAIDSMVQYNLDAHDAVHLACAMLEGVYDLASFDRGFRRVDGLVLWNNGLYQAQPT